MQCGDLRAAHAKFSESLAISRALVAELNTPESRRDLRIALVRLGEIDMLRGDLDAAHAKFSECLTISRALVAELNTPESCRDLIVALDRLGEIDMLRGDHDAAVRRTEEALAVAVDFCAQSPAPEALAILIHIKNKLAWRLALLAQRGLSTDPAGALATVEQAHALAAESSSEESTDPARLDTAAHVWEVTAACLTALGRHDESREAQSRADSIRARIAPTESP